MVFFYPVTKMTDCVILINDRLVSLSQELRRLLLIVKTKVSPGGGHGVVFRRGVTSGLKMKILVVMDTLESVLWMPERNEEDTGWVRPKDKEVTNTQNKVKDDPLPTVKQRKDLFVKTLSCEACEAGQFW
jgi:hypothetical protein